MNRRLLGIFGGTFDPVHHGHLRPVLEVQQALNMAGMRLVPAKVPPHRPQPRLAADARLHLLRLAAADYHGFSVDTRELQRSGPSYMVDTLASLRAESGADDALCLILGMDAFLGLPTWYRWRELERYAHIVVLNRPGSRRPVNGEFRDWLAERELRTPAGLREAPAGRVWFQPVTQLDISATSVRRLIAQGRSAQFLMPLACWRLMAREGWYGYPQVG
nr:nicotinate-nucleotide adenylyltransferase [Alkalilimnicola sp. S0819]